MTSTEFLADRFAQRKVYLRVRRDDPDKGRHGGVELRLVCDNRDQQRTVKASLKGLGIKHRRVYRKQLSRRQWVVPIYARADILTLLEVVNPFNAVELATRVREAVKRPTHAELKFTSRQIRDTFSSGDM